MLTLRPARVDEAHALTALCLRSKATWGYDAAFLEACRAELAITTEKLATSRVEVAELDGSLAGMARLSFAEGGAELAALFVEPAFQRAGVGRALFDWVVSECRAHAVTTLAIESDPGAAPFYRRMGAREVGLVPSGSIPGRFLPRLELALSP